MLKITISYSLNKLIQQKICQTANLEFEPNLIRMQFILSRLHDTIGPTLYIQYLQMLHIYMHQIFTYHIPVIFITY